MRLALGDPVVASLPAPADPPPNMGARVEVPYTRTIVSAWQVAVLQDTGSMLQWVVTLECPVAAGDYCLVWRDGGAEPPASGEVFVPLMVVTADQYPILVA